MAIGKADDPVAKAMLAGIAYNNDNWQEADEREAIQYEHCKPSELIKMPEGEAKEETEKMDSNEEGMEEEPVTEEKALGNWDGWAIKDPKTGKYWEGNSWRTGISNAETHKTRQEAEAINERDGLQGKVVELADYKEKAMPTDGSLKIGDKVVAVTDNGGMWRKGNRGIVSSIKPLQIEIRVSGEDPYDVYAEAREFKLIKALKRPGRDTKKCECGAVLEPDEKRCMSCRYSDGDADAVEQAEAEWKADNETRKRGSNGHFWGEEKAIKAQGRLYSRDFVIDVANADKVRAEGERNGWTISLLSKAGGSERHASVQGRDRPAIDAFVRKYKKSLGTKFLPNRGTKDFASWMDAVRQLMGNPYAPLVAAAAGTLTANAITSLARLFYTDEWSPEEAAEEIAKRVKKKSLQTKSLSPGTYTADGLVFDVLSTIGRGDKPVHLGGGRAAILTQYKIRVIESPDDPTFKPGQTTTISLYDGEAKRKSFQTNTKALGGSALAASEAADAKTQNYNGPRADAIKQNSAMAVQKARSGDSLGAAKAHSAALKLMSVSQQDSSMGKAHRAAWQAHHDEMKAKRSGAKSLSNIRRKYAKAAPAPEGKEIKVGDRVNVLSGPWKPYQGLVREVEGKTALVWFPSGKRVRLQVSNLYTKALSTNNKAAPNLRAGQVFKSKDKTGDLVGELMYASRVSGNRVRVVFTDGASDWFMMDELNIDPSSIKNRGDYDHDYEGDLM